MERAKHRQHLTVTAIKSANFNSLTFVVCRSAITNCKMRGTGSYFDLARASFLAKTSLGHHLFQQALNTWLLFFNEGKVLTIFIIGNYRAL